MTSADRGRRCEWIVRDYFERFGCEVTRSAGSLGPADIIAWDNVRFYLVAVRMNRWPSPAVRARLAKLKAPSGTVKLAARVARKHITFLDLTLGGTRQAIGSLSFLLGSHIDRKLEEMVSGGRERMSVKLPSQEQFGRPSVTPAVPTMPTKKEKG